MSSNQRPYSLGNGDAVREDNFVFFRPTHSEAVLQQFGPVLDLRGWSHRRALATPAHRLTGFSHWTFQDV